MGKVEPFYVDVRELNKDDPDVWNRVSGSSDIVTAIVIADAIRNFTRLYCGEFEIRVTNIADLNISA